MLRERSENGAKREAPPQSGEARKEYKNAVSRCRIVDENVRDSPHELTLLNDWRAAHECGQEETTRFYK